MTANTAKIDIRPAALADAQAIAEIHVAAWQATYAGIMPASFLAGLSVEQRTAKWRNALETGRPRVALALTAGGLAGWVAYGPSRDADKDAAWGEIEAIYLHPSHCGQGIGAALVEHAGQSLRAMGHTSVSLWVLADNHRARAFYARDGFVAEDQIQTFEIGGTRLGEVRYWKALP
ncbi:GNAT family N-acetyltransferase [Paraburkholderia sp. Se-20369]|nr:GNAT family N-acetyltransferase [Paraburkholderia sp. Se-20369]TCW79687.1 N-acetyltransferase [Burkholderia sp. SRS-46]